MERKSAWSIAPSFPCLLSSSAGRAADSWTACLIRIQYWVSDWLNWWGNSCTKGVEERLILSEKAVFFLFCCRGGREWLKDSLKWFLYRRYQETPDHSSTKKQCKLFPKICSFCHVTHTVSSFENGDYILFPLENRKPMPSWHSFTPEHSLCTETCSFH